MKLKKELVDELIKATKELFGNSYNKMDMLLDNFSNSAGKVRDISNYYTTDLISNLAMFTQQSGKGTYEDIYKALAIFGVIVE